jgi:coenzyme Q-binding protein COQ10
MDVQVANIFFNEVQARLVGAFEDRCRAVYGPSLITAGR